MTNGDKIRNMTDEELANWLDKILDSEREDWDCPGCYHCVYYKTHHYPKDCGDCEWLSGLIQWLKNDVK